MKKTLLTFIIFSSLSAFAYSQNNSGELLAINNSELNSKAIFTSVFDAGQPENSVIFYPNPVKDYMTVRFPQRGNYTVHIYNIVGESIKEKSGYDSNEIELNLIDLPKGMYFVSYEFGGKIITKRFSKAQ